MSRKKFISKKYYQVLFTAIFSILILLSGLLSYLALSFYASGINNKKLSAANEYLEDTAVSYKELTREIDVLYAFLLSNNSTVTEYLTARGKNNRPETETLQTIRNIGSLNTYISSIVLYNHVNDTYLSSEASFDMKLFLKAFLKNSAENLPAQAKQKAVFAYYDPDRSGDNGGPDYLSMVYYILNKYTQTYYCVVFNLDTEKIGTGILGDTRENAYLVNEFGSIVAAHSGTAPVTSIPFSWIKKASAGTSDGTFTERLNGENYLISYRRLDTTDWYCFTVNKSSTFLLHSPYLLLLLCLISILLSLGLTSFLSKKLYSPIHYTITELDQIAGASELGTGDGMKNRNDEFAYVNSIVTALSDKVQDLKLENSSNMEILKKSFLKTLIQENGPVTDLEKAWRIYNIQLFGPEIYLLLVDTDYITGREQINGLSFSEILQAGLENTLADLCSFELIPRTETQYMILYTPKTGGMEYHLPKERLQKLQEFVSLAANASITLVPEGNCYPAARIYEGYKNAVRLLKERFILGYGKIISRDEIDTLLSVMTTYPDELIKGMIESIKQRDKENFLERYDKLTDFLRTYVYQDVIRILIHLVDQMANVMRSITVDSQYLNMDFSSVDELFHSVHTLKETKGWFIQIFDQYLKTLQHSALNKNDIYWDAVKQAQESIRKNLGDPNLSIDRISEVVGYSSNYFSKIFKSLTGVYLKDYIKNVRISYAISLLAETDMTVNEISNRTGFVNQNYFFAAFKKETGMTPAVYRKQHGKKKEDAGNTK